MNRLSLLLSVGVGLALGATCPTDLHAQGWPEHYGGVMLQAFSWDDYDNAQWKVLEAQAKDGDFDGYFTLLWVPQSGNCDGKSMGYNPKYYFDQNSSFGSESELRSMIQTLRAHGIGTIADVVVNHRQNLSNWVDFPAETYRGVTYQMLSTDIPYDDDGGKCKQWADANGYQLSPRKDSGEGWDGMRDLDHGSDNVQRIVRAYEDFLLHDIGYAGFRYDVGKGFAARYFGMYNAAAQPEFSVGEVWDNTTVTRRWIDGTAVQADGTEADAPQSAAFDFQFRYAVRDMVSSAGYVANNSPVFDTHEKLINTPAYRRYAVTFVENHDTQDRTPTGGAYQDPLTTGQELAANAILLGMPGTPCVFQPHWLAYKNDIKQMIQARQWGGVDNQSEWKTISSRKAFYAFSCADLAVIVGKPTTTNLGTDWQLVQSVDGQYYYFLRRSVERPWATLAPGTFQAGTQQEVTLIAVSQQADARIVYTTDGSEPTATHGTVVPSGTSLTLTETTELRYCLLAGGKCGATVKRVYRFVEADVPQPFEAYKATMHVRDESGAIDPINVYVWAGKDNTQINGGWPGRRAPETVEAGGYTWQAQTFDITSADYVVNLVFANASGTVQTVDVTGMTHDAWYVITSAKSGSKYVVRDDTEQYAALPALLADPDPTAQPLYDLLGRRVRQPRPGVLYLRSGRPFVIR